MAAAEAIFYMTGTGNSYQAAMWWAALSGGSVPRQLTAERWQPATTAAERLVFCYPTHGFTAPWLIWQRLWELPAGQGQAAVLLPTRAGTRCLGRSFPGMEGTAGYLPALLLAFKGYRVQVVAALDMPSNWTALHWGLSADNAAVLRTAAQQKIQIIWQAVADGRRYWRGWLPFTLGIALLGVSISYLLLGQLLAAKLFFASEKCTACGLCATLCPQQAIRLCGKPPRPYWQYHCDSCMACMNYCPQAAIEASPVVAVGFYYLLLLPVAAWLGVLTGQRLPEWLGNLLHYGYALLSAAALYAGCHYLLRFRWLRRSLALLAHTRYFRRYRGAPLRRAHAHLQEK